MKQELDNRYYSHTPGLISWLIAVFSTVLIIYSIGISDQFLSDIQNVSIRERINDMIETNIRPDLILEDKYIKSQPDAIKLKIEKSIMLYNSIYGEEFERAKIMAYEQIKNQNGSSKELIELITLLAQFKRELSIPQKAKRVPPEKIRKDMKEEALILTKKLIKRVSLPRRNRISEITLLKIKNILNDSNSF